MQPLTQNSSPDPARRLHQSPRLPCWQRWEANEAKNMAWSARLFYLSTAQPQPVLSIQVVGLPKRIEAYVPHGTYYSLNQLQKQPRPGMEIRRGPGGLGMVFLAPEVKIGSDATMLADPDRCSDFFRGHLKPATCTKKLSSKSSVFGVSLNGQSRSRAAILPHEWLQNQGA